MACIPAACLSILLIGFTRIYLGAHFLSDILGAFAAGIFWLASAGQRLRLCAGARLAATLCRLVEAAFGCLY